MLKPQLLHCLRELLCGGSLGMAGYAAVHVKDRLLKDWAAHSIVLHAHSFHLRQVPLQEHSRAMRGSHNTENNIPPSSSVGA